MISSSPPGCSYLLAALWAVQDRLQPGRLLEIPYVGGSMSDGGIHPMDLFAFTQKLISSSPLGRSYMLVALRVTHTYEQLFGLLKIVCSPESCLRPLLA